MPTIIQPKQKLTLETVFRVLSLNFCVFILTIVTLAFFDYLNRISIIISVLFFVVFSLLYLRKRIRNTKWFTPKREYIAILIILLVVVINSFFWHDLPKGRDPMAYLASAVEISENGGLTFQDDLANPYPPFRELTDSVFISQFLPAYSVYLSIFITLGNIDSLFLANAILLFFALIAIFYTVKSFSNHKTGIGAVLLISSFYSIIWFTRTTDVEILSLFLIWCGVWFFVSGYQKNDYKSLIFGLAFFSLNLLTRGEAFLFFIMYILALTAVLLSDKWESKKSHRRQSFFAITSLWGIVLFGWYLIKFRANYFADIGTEYVENILQFKNLETLIIIIFLLLLLLFVYILLRLFNLNPQSIRKINYILIFLLSLGYLIYNYLTINSQVTTDWNNLKLYYLTQVFLRYYILLLLPIILYGFYNKYFNKGIKWIIFILLPTLIFFLHPGIAVDHPWFMRRFIVTFIPLIFILLAIGISKIKFIKHAIFVTFLLFLVINFSIAWPISFFTNHEQVDQGLEGFASNFSSNDIVLFQPGWGWQQWSYALHFIYGLNVLPNANGYDLDEFLRIIDNYDNIYIVSTIEPYIYPYFPKTELTKEFEYNLSYDNLDSSFDLTNYILEEGSSMDINFINEEFKSIPPSNIIESSYDLIIYKFPRHELKNYQ